jgi:hypothetical protein
MFIKFLEVFEQVIMEIWAIAAPLSLHFIIIKFVIGSLSYKKESIEKKKLNEEEDRFFFLFFLNWYVFF